jgi:hypothetical protein
MITREKEDGGEWNLIAEVVRPGAVVYHVAVVASS